MKKQIQVLTVLAASVLSMSAYAGVTTDREGNVGYDTAAECDAAVHAGTARFYTPFTHKPALKRNGEKSVRQAVLRDLSAQYQYGACDLGVGRSFGRDGVSTALQGKYVPFSPDMPVNAYIDATGNVVRVTMRQCDNNFSGNAPRPVAAPVRVETPAPVVEPVVAPVVEPAAPVEETSSVRPYVFGTLGALQDGVKLEDGALLNDKNTRFAGQVGAGVQFNNLVGVEAFYQGAAKHRFTDELDTDSVRVRNNTLGARLTLGSDIGDKFRVFGKVGVAAVRHSISEDGESWKQTKARPTAGIGMLVKFTDNVALRADYDHYFRKSTNIDGVDVKWKGSNYLGAGVQYTF